jgi:hypothetical protein
MLTYLLQVALLLLTSSDASVKMSTTQRSQLQQSYEQQDEAKLRVIVDEVGW